MNIPNEVLKNKNITKQLYNSPENKVYRDENKNKIQFNTTLKLNELNKNE